MGIDRLIPHRRKVYWSDMVGFWRFLQYHNAVPIALGILVLGGGSAFAAANPEAIYSAQETVVAIDNTYIAAKDFSNWTPKAQIVSVTEDEDFYYVTYKLSTIDLVDAVWRDAVKEQAMKVSKADLGPYRDLGLYVTEQLKQVVDRDRALLVETQEFERRAVSQKTVATIYGGLVGQLLDTSTETLPGYIPVVVAPAPAVHGQVAGAAASAPASSNASVVSTSADAPIIQVLGKNPAVIPTGGGYADLGAVVSDDKDRNIGIHVFVDGNEVTSVSLDTSTTTEYRIVYRATDTDGRTTEVYRRVVVYDRTQPAPVVEQIPPMLIPEVQAIEKDQSSPASISENMATSTVESTVPTDTATTTPEGAVPASDTGGENAVSPTATTAEPTSIPASVPGPIPESTTATQPTTTSETATSTTP